MDPDPETIRAWRFHWMSHLSLNEIGEMIPEMSWTELDSDEINPEATRVRHMSFSINGVSGKIPRKLQVYN